jgi:transcriptional regulator GlxA family with amidase domain
MHERDSVPRRGQAEGAWTTPHRVAVLALDGVVPFDLSLPVEVFGRARLPAGDPAYEVLVCGPAPELAAGPITIRVRHGLSALATADTVVVAGVDDVDRPVPPAVVAALGSAPAENLDRPLTLHDIAARAAMSTRSLSRRFRAQTGASPASWLGRHRVRRAQLLLESTDRPVERIARDVGFGSPTAFRERFRAVVGVSPRDYRRSFRG